MASPPKRYAAKLQWSEVKIRSEKPSPRWGCAHCLCDNDRLFVSGGCGKDRDNANSYVYFADAWFLRPEADGFKWEKLPPPPAEFDPRCNHTATRIGDVVWIIGGQAKEAYYGNVFTFDIKTSKWQLVPIKAQTEFLCRAGHCAVVATDDRSKIIIFGGHAKQKNATPQLVMLDTVSLTAVDFRTLGTKRLDRTFGLAFELPESNRVLFLGGADLQSKVPVDGAACLSLERRHWQEKYITDGSLSHLIGARGVRYQGKIYIHGGRYMKDHASYSNDLIEIGSGRLPPHCDIRLIQSEGLAGTMDHMLFLIGEWMYCLHGKGMQSNQDARLYRASLSSLSEEATSKRPAPLPVPTIPPPMPPIASAANIGAVHSTPVALSRHIQSQTAQNHVVPLPAAPAGAESGNLSQGFVSATIAEAVCENADYDGGKLKLRWSVESVVTLPDGLGRQSRERLMSEISTLKQQLTAATSKCGELEKTAADKEKRYKDLLRDKDKQIGDLRAELESKQREHEQALSQLRAWLSDVPMGMSVTKESPGGTSALHAAKKCRRQ